MRPLLRGDIENLQLNSGDFLFLDSVSVLHPGHKAVGHWYLDHDFWIFDLHFPGRPILPASFLLESMSQLSGLTYCAREGFQRTEYNTVEVERFKVKAPSFPGDRLDVFVQTLKYRRGVIDIEGRIECEKSVRAMGFLRLVSKSEFLVK